MEKEEYRRVGSKNFLDVFNKQIAAKILEYGKKHLPFDEPCARLEFRDKFESAEKESERKMGFVSDDIKVEIGDLDNYGKPELFELIEDQEDYVDRVIEGSRTQVVVGHTLSYKCKKRGHGISVFIPIAEYNKSKEVKGQVKENKREK